MLLRMVKEGGFLQVELGSEVGGEDAKDTALLRASILNACQLRFARCVILFFSFATLFVTLSTIIEFTRGALTLFSFSINVFTSEVSFEVFLFLREAAMTAEARSFLRFRLYM